MIIQLTDCLCQKKVQLGILEVMSFAALSMLSLFPLGMTAKIWLIVFEKEGLR